MTLVIQEGHHLRTLSASFYPPLLLDMDVQAAGDGYPRPFPFLNELWESVWL